MKRTLILILTLVMVLSLAGCARSDFNQPVDITNIAQALSARGLQPCSKNELKWTAVPGFVQGMQYDVDMNCANYDPNFPAARVYLAKFDSAEARDGALRNFETIYQRRIGAGFARAIGPWILVVDGNQKILASALVREVLSDLGVK
jgi:hypothetical protein